MDVFAPWGSGGSRAAMVTSASSAVATFVYWDSSNGWSGGLSRSRRDEIDLRRSLARGGRRQRSTLR